MQLHCSRWVLCIIAISLHNLCNTSRMNHGPTQWLQVTNLGCCIDRKGILSHSVQPNFESQLIKVSTISVWPCWKQKRTATSCYYLQIFPTQRYCLCHPFLFSFCHQHIYKIMELRNNNCHQYYKYENTERQSTKN